MLEAQKSHLSSSKSAIMCTFSQWRIKKKGICLLGLWWNRPSHIHSNLTFVSIHLQYRLFDHCNKVLFLVLLSSDMQVCKERAAQLITMFFMMTISLHLIIYKI